MTKREPLSSVAGKPNPEIERLGGPQMAMLFIVVFGFVILIGLLAYLPSVATPLK